MQALAASALWRASIAAYPRARLLSGEQGQGAPAQALTRRAAQEVVDRRARGEEVSMEEMGKVLFAPDPGKNRFGWGFHAWNTFLAMLPPAAVVCLGLYAGEERKRMEAEFMDLQAANDQERLDRALVKLQGGGEEEAAGEDDGHKLNYMEKRQKREDAVGGKGKANDMLLARMSLLEKQVEELKSLLAASAPATATSIAAHAEPPAGGGDTNVGGGQEPGPLPKSVWAKVGGSLHSAGRWVAGRFRRGEGAVEEGHEGS